MAIIISALAGAYSANRQASAAKAAAKNAGKVDLTTTRTPWGPSEGGRIDLMNRARELGVRDVPTFSEWGGGAGGAGGQKRRGGGGGGGGRAGATPGFTGVSPETDRIRQEMIERADAGSPLYAAGEKWTTDTLAGKDPNAYRAETFDALRDVGDDPDLRKLKDYLFGQLEPGAGGGGGGGGRSGYGNFAAYTPGGGGGGGGDAGGVSSYLKDILEGKYLTEGNPYLEGRIADVMKDVSKAERETIADANRRAQGAGMLGSSYYGQLLKDAAGESELARTRGSGELRFGDFDKRMAEFLQAAGLQAQIEGDQRAAGAAGAGAAASAQAAADRLALERQLGLVQALGGAVGMGGDLTKFGLSGMAGLSGALSEDQALALQAVPTLSGLALRDWGAAGDLSLGADQLRGQYDLGLRDISARRGASNQANNLARQRLNFDIYQNEMALPLQQATAAGGLIGLLSDPYFTQRETGLDRRSQAPYQGSVGGQTIAGGIGGAMMGAQLRDYFNMGGGGTTSAGRVPEGEPWLGGRG